MQNKTFYILTSPMYPKHIDTGKQSLPVRYKLQVHKLQVANSKFVHKNNLQPDEII